MGDIILSRFMFPLTLPGCAVLAIAGLGCLFYYKGKYRRHLVRTAAVFLGALALYIGGIALLGFFQMTWRDLPALILCGALLASGWTGVVLILICFLPMELPRLPKAVQWASKGAVALFAAVVLVVTLWFGPMAILFAYGSTERMIEYQGQTLVEVDDGFLDPHWSYYVYHGPLVRGTERVYDGYEPLDHG